MFLKSLTLRGFKTFADATTIEFSPDARITAIVGPNGCGKSNLLDATRWVLGEDNPRLLRVAALENIIFAGTAERKPVSLAEVTMIFDNASAKLPVPYTEVAVRRRTFREGESEFFINKNLCRLKDIKDLFMDTGVGEGSYAIITQGQVDAILSSKGEERRLVFEEAAGINKYKTRKLAAEKKLIAAEQNILRINDLKVEVSEHVINLEDQARKAREYLEVQARVKELEIGLAKKTLALLLEKKSRLEEELNQARQASEGRMAEEKKYEEELAAFKEALRRNEIESEDLAAKLDAEKDRLRDIELNRRFLEGELQRDENRLKELESKRDDFARRTSALKAEAASPGGELSGSFAGISRIIVDEARLLVSRLASVLSSLGHGEIFSILEPKEREATRALKLELLQAEVGRAEEEMEKINFSLHAHRAELEGSCAGEETAAAKAGLIETQAKLRQERENLKNKIAELEENIRQEERTERAASTSVSTLEIALAKLEGELTGLSERLLAEYNLSLPEIEASPHSVANTARAKTEIEEGKSRMRSLEPVNLLAIEEFEKTRERLSFIEAQLADLGSARENLRNLITELDLRAEESFIQTMRQLSSVFSETFAKLFAGGEARISLAGDLPPLEAEIEISVRPAGRRWLPLSLLSGGERSLCAIAILFSLLKIRPSPFCFLDEVDAALDEANIGRFTEMLKDFSSASQIVIISHNKRTMAAADNIYGITMEELGVSKVISMKLAEAAVA